MSDSSETLPKSIRHKQVLDLAAKHPDATCEEIAAEIPSATADLVDRVLEKYGDPAVSDETPHDAGEPAPDPPMDEDPSPDERTVSEHTEDSAASEGAGESPDDASHPDTADLTPKERKTLRLIYEHPDATQREIADLLDVSTPTVNTRVNAIEGFDWENRRAFTDALFQLDPNQSAAADEEIRADGATSTEAETDAEASADEGRELDKDATTGASTMDAGQIQERFGELSSQLSAIESRLDDLASGGSSGERFDDPELAQKVIHACVHSDNISEEEELRLLREFIQ